MLPLKKAVLEFHMLAFWFSHQSCVTPNNTTCIVVQRVAFDALQFSFLDVIVSVMNTLGVHRLTQQALSNSASLCLTQTKQDSLRATQTEKNNPDATEQSQDGLVVRSPSNPVHVS